MPHVHRIEVRYKTDPRLKVRTDRIRSLGFMVEELHQIDVYTIATTSRDFSADELREIASQLANPVVQEFVVDEATRANFDYAIEVGFLPGVTDNVGTTARQTIEDYFSMKFGEGDAVFSSQLYFVCGRIDKEAVQKLACTLANPLVNRVHVMTRADYGTSGMEQVVPFVELHEPATAEIVDLSIDDEELARIGKEGIIDRRPASAGGRLPSILPSSIPSATILRQRGAIQPMWRSRRLPRRGVSTASTQSLPRRWTRMCQRGSTRPVSRQQRTGSALSGATRTSA
jgi:phosphoribosylformylglycinamidine synthase